ncbi:hypothetical protein EUX98_g620 [Antrodiella citrinella]|uniref:CcmS related domain-containing protein n=1 Tax=Antrodiella citrinella TaxID=2447956 RepID=A0A4S4N3N1_9APHY|nr:hypothetical protein EUX98_g620 [Antrodiella citrinella]
MQHADSWGEMYGGGGKSGGDKGGGNGFWPIHEDARENDKFEHNGWDNDYDDDLYADDDGGGGGGGSHDRHGHRVRPDLSYQLQTPNDDHAQRRHNSGPPPAPAPDEITELLNMDPRLASNTMNIATGRTTTLELAPYREGEKIDSSNGEAIKPAQRAMYGRTRLARDRIHWGFAPMMDQRIIKYMNWIDVASNHLAALGLQYFLTYRKRGALMTNVDFQVRTSGAARPTFDWITKDLLQPTWDRILQESVITYKPAKTVVVFIFLPSKSTSSIACWRKKIAVPAELSRRFQQNIEDIVDEVDDGLAVLVDELPASPPPPPQDKSLPGPEKKKKRGFWRRLFGIK